MWGILLGKLEIKRKVLNSISCLENWDYVTMYSLKESNDLDKVTYCKIRHLRSKNKVNMYRCGMWTEIHVSVMEYMIFEPIGTILFSSKN